jgi:hypothetical protein
MTRVLVGGVGGRLGWVDECLKGLGEVGLVVVLISYWDAHQFFWMNIINI